MTKRTGILLGAILGVLVLAGALWAFLGNPLAPDRAVFAAPVLAPAELAAPGDGVAAVDGADDTELSLNLATHQYASSPVLALTTPEQLDEVSAAVAGLRVPIVVLPAAPTADQVEAVRAEAERLGVTAVANQGVALPDDVAGEFATVRVTLLKAPADPGPRTYALVADAATQDLVGALLSPTSGQALVVEGDPRGSVEAVSAIAADPGAAVLIVGDLAADDDFQWQLETVLTGVELPGGGQLVAPGKLYVALYGHPGSSALGVLGEQGVDATIERARQHAAPYEALTDMTVVPSLEIIATIASAGAGPDGNYSAEADIATLRPLVDAAGENGLYVVLDLQPGRTDFLTQAKRYEELLALPHVGLALDPEWRLEPDQVHLRQIGSVGIDEVNSVVTWLADFTREHRLPQKVLILHSFRTDMITGIDRLDTSRSELAITMHVDGQGAQGAKQDTWNVLHRYAPNMPYWGWKNFYDEDSPTMLTPQQTMSNVNPTPIFVSYQ